MTATSLLLRVLSSVPFLFFTFSAYSSPLFDDDSVIDVELVGPLGSLIANKKHRNEASFVLRADGIDYTVSVRVRGKSRTRVCDFLPLRIRFSDDTSGTVFDGQNKLKLVTQCRSSARARTGVLEEFAAYRIFNSLTDFGYNVRLLHIRYTDTDKRLNEKLREQYGFLIESSTELANRMGAVPAHVAGVTRSSLDDNQAAVVYVFQYLIGNTDWSLVTADGDDECCHNGDLFKRDLQIFYVPYDFDLSGLVNARYARPDPTLGTRSVTQRRYRGYCTSSEALGVAIHSIKDRQPEILELVAEIPGLTQKDIDTTVKYLNQFFAKASNATKLQKSFEKRCL